MLQFITHQTDRFTTLEGARMALDGGCRWVQLRMKGAPLLELMKTAVQLKKYCEEYNATLIIDDDPGVCMECGADGVHLGKQDMDPLEARRWVGDSRIIGGTANTVEDIRSLHAKGVDYIGLGPFRFTQTKRNLSAILGLEGYREIMEKCRKEGIDLPVVAIGGIGYDDIPAILDTGINGIALSGSLLQAPDPQGECRRIMEYLENRNKK